MPVQVTLKFTTDLKHVRVEDVATGNPCQDEKKQVYSDKDVSKGENPTFTVRKNGEVAKIYVRGTYHDKDESVSNTFPLYNFKNSEEFP